MLHKFDLHQEKIVIDGNWEIDRLHTKTIYNKTCLKSKLSNPKYAMYRKYMSNVGIFNSANICTTTKRMFIFTVFVERFHIFFVKINIFHTDRRPLPSSGKLIGI